MTSFHITIHKLYSISANIILAATLIYILAACTDKSKKPIHSMYYWSTTFNLSNSKKDFLKRHQINRLYIRYFDIVVDNNSQLMPNATIRFADSIPQSIEVVPTVFIVNDCMKVDTRDLAKKIVKRILQMNETNDIMGVKEIQIDCDWTTSTRNSFFNFMNQLRQIAHTKGFSISATIRLHQLSQTPPPADRGILMLYNTGDFTNISCQKPILDMNDVAPYLPNISSYQLSLSTAYPIFGWHILFRQRQYVGILHADDDLPIIPNDSIVERQPSINDILDGVRAIERKRSEANNEIILFDLTDNNIKKFKQYEYEKIYNRGIDCSMHN